jgi:post-segregation antitoxin (ccd killing protein)
VKRAVNLTLSSDLLARAKEAGLNLSALAEEAVEAALSRIAQDKLAAEIAQACQVHADYLVQYGSLRDWVRLSNDGGE